MLELYSPDFCAKLMDPSISLDEWKTSEPLQQMLMDAHDIYRGLSKTPEYFQDVQAQIEDMAQEARVQMEKKESEFKIQQSRYYELYAIAEVF